MDRVETGSPDISCARVQRRRVYYAYTRVRFSEHNRPVAPFPLHVSKLNALGGRTLTFEKRPIKLDDRFVAYRRPCNAAVRRDA